MVVKKSTEAKYLEKYFYIFSQFFLWIRTIKLRNTIFLILIEISIIFLWKLAIHLDTTPIHSKSNEIFYPPNYKCFRKRYLIHLYPQLDFIASRSTTNRNLRRKPVRDSWKCKIMGTLLQARCIGLKNILVMEIFRRTSYL